MSRSYELLPIGDNAPEEVNAVIEIPRGSSNKYEYDREHGIFAWTVHSTARFSTHLTTVGLPER